MNVISIGITQKNQRGNDKPNEDFYLMDDKNGIYIIVDGVSRDRENGVYPNPSPAAEVSQLFVQKAYDYLKNHIKEEENIEELIFRAMAVGNDEIALYNQRQKWADDFYPGTVGIIACLKREHFYYGYIGDCYGVYLNLNRRYTNVFTKCQTEKIALHKKEFTSYEIRNVICNNMEHPYSYGVLNGNKAALDFVEIAMFPIYNNDRILLCTDGVADALKGLLSRKIYGISLEDILRISKETDDKTIISIKVQEYGKENY